MRTGLAALVALTLASMAPPVAADGGTVRLMERAGAFVVAVFSAPEPLRVGPADLSVLVLDPADGHPLLDAEVTLETIPPHDTDALPERLDATHEQATNKLLYATPFAPAAAGEWTLRVTVRRGAESAEVGCVLPVAPSPPLLARIWPYLAIPPAAVAVYVLGAWLAARRPHPQDVAGRPASRRGLGSRS